MQLPNSIHTAPVFKAQITKTQQQPKFGNAEALAVKYAAPEIKKFTQTMDYRTLGETTVNMIKVIYGTSILSRFAAAATRSWNELREAVTRDTLGYAFWLFLVPILQRGTILLGQKDPDFKNALIKTLDEPTASGLTGSLKKFMYKFNPTSRWKITSSEEIQDWTKQTLDFLKKEGHEEGSDAVKQATEYFEKLLAKRRVVTGLGFAITIATIGVGINYFNMWLTEKAVKEGKVGKY